MENLETPATVELRPIHYNDETLATVGLYRVKLSLYKILDIKKPSVETPGLNQNETQKINPKKIYSNSLANSFATALLFFAVLIACSFILIRTSCSMYLFAKFVLTNLFSSFVLYTTLYTSCIRFSE